MKLRSLTLVLALALLALAVPLAVASPDASHQASTSKKKKSYCQKKISKEKGKSTRKVKSAKFYLAITKRPTEYFFCSEAQKFSGSIAAWDGIKKTSHLRAVKNNCAIFYSESKKGSSFDSGYKSLKIVEAKQFKKGAVNQTFASNLGKSDEKVSLVSLTLAKNCVFAAGYVLDGVPMISIAGIGNFPYGGFYDRPIVGASVAELKSIKVKYISKVAAQVTWTQGGVPKALNYPSDVQN